MQSVCDVSVPDLFGLHPLTVWGKRPLPLWCFKLCMWSVCCLVNGEREDDRGKEGWGGGRGGGGGGIYLSTTTAPQWGVVHTVSIGSYSQTWFITTRKESQSVAISLIESQSKIEWIWLDKSYADVKSGMIARTVTDQSLSRFPAGCNKGSVSAIWKKLGFFCF